MARLNYLELPVGDAGTAKRFYAAAFDWDFIDVPDLEAALAAVRAAGGEITASIFAFPGGRRFHFRDPDGHEIGVVQSAGNDGDPPSNSPSARLRRG